MRKLILHNRTVIPAILTSANIFCGFLSITYILEGHYLTASWLIILAAVFDALDGVVARLINSYSKFGVEFDSLADLISFGLAPSILIYSAHLQSFGELGVLIAFLPLVCGAIRLARFNINFGTFVKEHFNGLPIPMYATTLSSYLIFSDHIWGSLQFSVFFIPFIVFLSFLMVSQIEYDAMPKFTLRKDASNTRKLILFMLASIFVILFPKMMIFPVSILFVLMGFVRSVFQFRHHHEEEKVFDASRFE